MTHLEQFSNVSLRWLNVLIAIMIMVVVGANLLLTPYLLLYAICLAFKPRVLFWQCFTVLHLLTAILAFYYN